MGVTEYPCPKCGQTQKVRAPNGQEIFPALCAACREKENAARESQGSGNAKEEKHEAHDDKKARAR